MKGQSALILGFIAALIIAVFAVINVDGVKVSYLFGTAEWPLILVIFGSVLMGAVIVGSFGMIKVYRLQQEIKQLKKQSSKEGTSQREKSNSRKEENSSKNEDTKST
ncbi:DUF1049 domain-containing protein [Salibacterium salarium]|uniref:DUF1049 domain-containing protein n=1 Tax=Salibacterium salarium TaxID=284579 RepID=A0A3R9P213_9BACI|nr:lipopolysaccharide assembly LapA domain-containing protein [Salibacterium salarium]RSL29244.1 DUF1049 domain-containing protein [Salibacterium salarium]